MRPWKTPARVVRIDEAAMQSSYLIASNRLPRETGGILIGYRLDNEIWVQFLVEVPDEEAGISSYVRRYAFAESALTDILHGEPTNSPLGYVGEWHTHPKPIGVSRQDIKEVCLIAKQASETIALVVLENSAIPHSWMGKAWTADQKRHHPAELLITRNTTEVCDEWSKKS